MKRAEIQEESRFARGLGLRRKSREILHLINRMIKYPGIAA